ncbi:MAG: hypothetical protein ABI639_10345 [Thermoanaerobaculia bacterium]
MLRATASAGIFLLCALTVPSRGFAGSGPDDISPDLTLILEDSFESGVFCAWSFATGATQICSTTIFEIQRQGRTGLVGLGPVVVTGFSSDRKHFWAADHQAAAPWEGMYFFRGAAAPLDGGVQIGSTVDVDGTVQEFATFTELVVNGVSVENSGPAPTALSGIGAATLSDGVLGEPYEGVLVQLSNLKISAFATGDEITLQDASNDTIVMDDKAYDYDSTSYILGDCFDLVRGVMHVDSSTGVRTILPRSADDLQPGVGCN